MPRPIHVREPLLSQIVSGQKKYDARLRKGFWDKVEKDTVLTFYNDKYASVEVYVVNVFIAKNFADVWVEFGREFVPEADSKTHVRRMYDAIYPYKDTVTYGVVAFEFRILRVVENKRVKSG